MNAACFFSLDRSCQRIRRDFIIVAHQRELRATREKLRRAAFVFVDMSDWGAENRLPRLGQGGEQGRIGRCAGGHEVDGGLGGFEDLADPFADPVHQGVCPIGHSIAFVCRPKRAQHVRVGWSCVVGCQKHQLCSSIMWSSHSSSGTSYSGTVQPRTEMPASWTLSGVPEISGCQS